jgi:hypothetical protein
METVILRMVSAVRRGFRTVFFKMSRTIFIAVLLLHEALTSSHGAKKSRSFVRRGGLRMTYHSGPASRPPSARAILGGAQCQCGRKLKRINPAKTQFYHGNRAYELGWRVLLLGSP